MTHSELVFTARSLVPRGKGILAADESLPTIQRRFDSIALESNEDTRRAYRHMLFAAPGLEDYISGVILFDESMRQPSDGGVLFPRLLERRGIVPGIKVDRGTTNLPGFPGEKITEGLDGLRERLDEYRELGARFTKWRAVITIGDSTPTRFCIDANAHALARFAALSQESGLVPIVESEVLMDGNHGIDRAEQVTEEALRSVFTQLGEHRVEFEELLLKTNMVLPGKAAPDQVGADEVARATIRCLRRVVPPAVPGIVFLSGGQGAELATEHLDTINRLGKQPWELSFSYARALQDPALRAWMGDEANVPAAQQALLHRARLNSAAREGRYTREMETLAA